MSDQSLMIRVSRSTHELLRTFAEQSQTTITSMVDEAVRELQRKRFWAAFNAACTASALSELSEEDAAWDNTLLDGVATERNTDVNQSKRPRGESGPGRGVGR